MEANIIHSSNSTESKHRKCGRLISFIVMLMQNICIFGILNDTVCIGFFKIAFLYISKD